MKRKMYSVAKQTDANYVVRKKPIANMFVAG